MDLAFQNSIQHLRRIGTKDEKHLGFIDKMILRRDRSRGIVIGFHGTSLRRALEIQNDGFKNCLCDEGGFGVYFWDEKFRDNAFTFAKEKAQKDGHKTIAIFKAKIYHPEPDWLKARPQWIVDANNIEIIQTYFCNINE